MVAPQDREVAANVREGSFFNILDPGAEIPQRHLVLRLAGYRTGMAPDTAPIIDDESKIHDSNPIPDKAVAPESEVYPQWCMFATVGTLDLRLTVLGTVT